MLAECASYLETIDDLRQQIRELIAGLPAEGLNWRPFEGKEDHATNSLAVLASHAAGAEHFWISEVIGRQPASRIREQEFVTVVDGPEKLLEKLDKTAGETRQQLAALTAEDLDGERQVDDRTVAVRWAILHVIDHTALHLGHMQVTYQLWRGGQGHNAPRWFQRLSD